jgi:hypothetical protein
MLEGTARASRHRQMASATKDNGAMTKGTAAE